MTDLADLRATVRRHAPSDPDCIPRFRIFQQGRPTEPAPLIYDPVVSLVLQGSKRTVIGDKTFVYGAGDILTVATEAVAIGQVYEATPEMPFLGLYLFLDPAVLSALLLDMEGLPEPAASVGFGMMEADDALLDAWARLVELFDSPEDIKVMAPRREDELLYRLLTGPQGALFRQIARADSRLSRVRQAIAWIRDHYAEPLRVADMAAVAGMSDPVFHRHFKTMTGLSPLQYQKQVQLHEARRRLVADSAEASKIAYSVGYESASQFSREYKRLFGMPPRQDAKRMQSAAG